MGPMQENETFCEFAQLKKDLGETATKSELIIVIANQKVGIKGTGLTLQYKPPSSWSLMALFLPAANRYY